MVNMSTSSSSRPAAGRREPRDGRSLRVVDEAFWARERDMLDLRLALLTDFMSAKGLSNSVQVQAEECRYLEYQIQCRHSTLARTGDDEDARDSLERTLESDASGRLDPFRDWHINNQEFKTLMLSHQMEPRSLEDSIEGQYKCFDFRCKHYVYGFETVDALRRHTGLHDASSLSAYRVSSTLQKRTSNMSLEDGGESLAPLAPQGNGYDRSSSEEDLRAIRSPFQKRTSLPSVSTLDDKRRVLAPPRFSLSTTSRPSGPCLRCRVLKKKCDCQNPCKECPQQDVMAPDLWKALGCFHGPLTELSKKCLQGFETSVLKIYIAEDRLLRFEVSYSDSKAPFWSRELEDLMSLPTFCNLENECWEDRKTRDFNADSINARETSPKLTEVTYTRLLPDYSPAIGLLKTAVLDPAYQNTTAFNPFALLRVGKTLASQCQDPTNWQLYSLAKELLVTVIRFREDFGRLESQLRETLDKYGPDIVGSMSLPDIETPLNDFMKAFDLRFTNRKELSVEGWLGTFYALCIMSVVKSVLIDASQPQQLKIKQAVYAAQLNNVYKVLVSVFSWSAKLSNWCPKEFQELRDPLLHNWTTKEGDENNSVSPPMQDGLRATQDLVKQSLWGRAGIKHTKDFLLSLGTGKFLDHGFNGFLVQVYGENDTGKSQEGSHRRHPSTVAMDIDGEPVSKKKSTPGMNETGRSAQERPRVPLPGSVYSGRAGGTPSGSHPQEQRRASDAMEDVGYYSTPSHANTGTRFTAISESTLGESERRNRHSARDYPSLADGYLKDVYREDQRLGASPRRSTPASSARPKPHGRTASFPASEPPLVPHDSYYRRPAASSVEELFHKRRRQSSPPAPGDDAAARGAKREGLENGTLTFSINEAAAAASSASGKRGKRRELSKEQREHAAAVRRLGACPECKARKVKCSPSHHRGGEEASSGSPQSPTAVATPNHSHSASASHSVSLKRRTESPGATSPADEERASVEEEAQEAADELLVVAMEE